MNFKSGYKRLVESLSGYSAAIRKASKANLLHVPHAVASVTRARRVFNVGPRFHSLYDFRSKHHEEWSDYLLDRDFKKKLRHANGDQRAFTGDKIRFTAHCVEHGLPTIPILALIDTRPSSATSSFPRASNPVELDRLLDNAPNRLFVKLIDGSLGIDAFDLAREGNGWRYCGRTGTSVDLYSFLVERLRDRRGWMIQPLVEPHRALKRIMAPNALGTVRAITFREGEKPVIALPILRIPAGNNVADNFSHGLSGNLVAPIDLHSGSLGLARFSRDRSWPDIVTTEEHPDTGEKITGFVLPFWQETKDLLLRAQASIGHMKTVGWDIAITDKEPIIVEANSTYDVDLLQVAHNRGLRQDFDLVLGTRTVTATAETPA